MAKRVQGQKAPDGAVRFARPLKAPRATQRPTGPKMFRPGAKPILLVDWATPPPGFLNGNNSISEYMIYKALSLLLGPESEGNWLYQGKVGMGGLPGGSKPDFVVFQQPPLAIRIQTQRYHEMIRAARQNYDDEQRIQLMRSGYNVVDIHETDYINDLTGKAALALTSDALQGKQRPNPVRMHTSLARG